MIKFAADRALLTISRVLLGLWALPHCPQEKGLLLPVTPEGGPLCTSSQLTDSLLLLLDISLTCFLDNSLRCAIDTALGKVRSDSCRRHFFNEPSCKPNIYLSLVSFALTAGCHPSLLYSQSSMFNYASIGSSLSCFTIQNPYLS